MAEISAYIGPFIATQLNSTSSWVELCRYKRALRRHFFLQALQCPCSMQKRFSRDHCCWGRSKPVYTSCMSSLWRLIDSELWEIAYSPWKNRVASTWSPSDARTAIANTSSVPAPCENGPAETTVAEGGQNPVAGLWGRTLGENWSPELTSSYATIDFWCQLVVSPMQTSDAWWRWQVVLHNFRCQNTTNVTLCSLIIVAILCRHHSATHCHHRLFRTFTYHCYLQS